MKNIYKIIVLLAVVWFTGSCTQETYEFGALTSPSEVTVVADVVGKTTANPNGDGTGVVNFTITGKNILATKVDFDADDAVDLVDAPNGKITKKYSTNGTKKYQITIVTYGAGGAATTVTKEVTVKVSFAPAASIVTALTGDTNSVSAHFGVGPADNPSPIWWTANVNEKVATANCFYTTTFKFSKLGAFNYTLQVTNPDGAFTKTGAFTSLPGIPASGDEGCYAYGGGTSSFSFAGATSGFAASTPSTQTSIVLSGVDTYIGVASVQKEYEILSISPTAMYLRVLGYGPESGNAWYLKLKPAQ
jgi:hypothetical protein